MFEKIWQAFQFIISITLPLLLISYLFKLLIPKRSTAPEKPHGEVYQEYKTVLLSKLTTLGFESKEEKFAGAGIETTRYRKNALEVELILNMRDDEVALSARSGKKKATKGFNGDTLIDKDDLSMALFGTDEEKIKLTLELDRWYLENS